MVSSVADSLALGQLNLVVDGLVGVTAFLLGAICCAVMVNFARRQALASEYALPLLLEAALILVFGLLGSQLASYEGLLVPFTVLLLCFIMGLQNAVMTKLSHGVIRTTHLTGTVTDLGIEIGKLVYWNRDPDPDTHSLVRADRERMAVLAILVLCFLAGGIAGAFGFKLLGYVSTVPLAVLLATIALVPTIDDLRRIAAPPSID
jgi:uncharacterized membrane protein YoaK (UPF0700 family)